MMEENKWTFKEVNNIRYEIKAWRYETVLGQSRKVVHYTGEVLIRNVNCAFFSGNNLWILGAVDKDCKLDATGVDNIFDGRVDFHFDNISSNHGFMQLKSGRWHAIYNGTGGAVTDKVITNTTIFPNNITEIKVSDKKMMLNDVNSPIMKIYSARFCPDAYYDKKGNRYKDMHTECTFTIGSYCFKRKYDDNFWSVGNNLVNYADAKSLDKSYPNNISSGMPDLTDLMVNLLYDMTDEAQVTHFTGYFLKDIYSIYYSNDRLNNADVTGYSIELRLSGDSLINATPEVIEKNTTLFKRVKYQNASDKRYVTFSFDEIKERINIIGNKCYVAIRCINPKIYKGEWAIVLVHKTEHYVYAGYSKPYYYITFTLSEDDPPYYKKDDEKGDGNDVRGDTPPSGSTPSDPSEIGLNLLTTTYLLSKAQLNSLGNELWSANFMNNVLMLSNSPIENVLSCKIFPTTFSGVPSVLKIGNVTMLSGQSVQKISANGLSKDTGAITFPQLYNSFLDFEPFTQARIFIPFVGFQPLPVANFIGAQLSLRYVFDVVTGAVSVYLLRNGNIFDKYSGICAVDVPLTASNRAQVEVGQIQSAITGVTQLATGNIGGALSTGLAIASTPNHFNTRGNAGGYTSQYDPRQPYLIIDRPKAQSEITSYGETSGFPCNLTKTLNTLKGFTSVHDVHLDDVPCLESERQELKAIMQKGFII